jgi:hypothetical protein
MIGYVSGHPTFLCNFCYYLIPSGGGIALVTQQTVPTHTPTVRVACGESCATGVTATLTAARPVRRLAWGSFVEELCHARPTTAVQRGTV